MNIQRLNQLKTKFEYITFSIQSPGNTIENEANKRKKLHGIYSDLLKLSAGFINSDYHAECRNQNNNFENIKTQVLIRAISELLEMLDSGTRPANRNTDPDIQVICDKIIKCLNWIESEDILRAEISLYHRRGMLSVQDDILITDHDFILGIIDYWESKFFIPVVKNGRNNRIIKNFKWKDTTGVIRDFSEDTLNAHRKSKHYYFMFEKIHK